MLASLQRPRIILLAVMINALAVLGFRYFITLDGPIHVLRAEVWRDHWTRRVHDVPGFHYDLEKMGLRFGDLMMAPFTAFLSPEQVHALYAVVILTLIGTGAWLMVRAYGHVPDVRLLWVLPLSFSWVLLLGFYPFLLAFSLCLLITAAWIGTRTITWWKLLVLAPAALLCAFAHRSGIVLLAVVLISLELVVLFGDKDRRAERWGRFPKWFLPLGLVLAAASAGVVAQRLLHRHVVIEGQPIQTMDVLGPAWQELIQVRPLLLVDRLAESPMLVALGLLFLASLAAAIIGRWRDHRRLHEEDGLLVAAILFIVGSLLIDPPYARLMYVPDRAQITGLILLAIWMAMQPLVRWSNALMVGVLALHLLRLNYVERRMATFRPAHDHLIACAKHLRPGTTVVPVYREDNWLLRHASAYLAALHPGVLYTSRDHMPFRWDEPPDLSCITYLTTFEGYWDWMRDHNAQGRIPRIQHIVVIGNARTDAWIEQERQLRPILARYYRETFSNGYVEVVTLAR